LGSYEEKMYEPLNKLVDTQASWIHKVEGVLYAVSKLQNEGRYEEAKILTNCFLDGLHKKK